MKKTILLIGILLIIGSAVFAQREISGKVITENGTPVSDVVVKLKNFEISTITEMDGSYRIWLPEKVKTLEYSKFDGKTVKEVKFISESQVNIILKDIDQSVQYDIFDLTLEEIMNLEVKSVSKKAEKLSEAPQTVIVLTGEEIRQRGYIDLEQALHDLPGFDISRGNGTQYSQIYQRGYRSNNTDRTLLLIDGVEENDLWSNSVWLSRQYPLSNVKRIEVIYGPASTIYGANAFVGVINIVTKTADDLLKADRKIGVSGVVNGGSWNTMFTDVTFAAKYKKLKFTLTGRMYKSDEMDLSGYDDWNYDMNDYGMDFYKGVLRGDKDIVIEDSWAQKAMELDEQGYYNDPVLGGVKPQYSNQTDDWAINGKISIEDFTFGYQIFKRKEGYGAWYRDDWELGPENGGSWGPVNSFLFTKYEKQIAPKLLLTSFTRFKVHSLADKQNEEFYFGGYMNGSYGLGDLVDLETNELLADPGQPYWWHAWYHTYSQALRSELKLFYDASDKFNVISGIEYRKSHIQGQYIYGYTEYPSESASAQIVDGGNHFYSTDIGFFAQANYRPVESFSIIGGGRVDNNTIRSTGGYGTVFSPKLALVYSPEKFVVKGIYSEAFKDAGNWTKFGTTPARQAINPTLEPERVRNVEFSLGSQLTSYLFADVAVYNASYSNVVGTGRTTIIDENGDEVETDQHQAVGSLLIRGVQANLNYKFKNYSAYLNYTFTNPKNEHFNTGDTTDLGETIYDSRRVGDIASHQVNFGVNARYFKKLDINLRGNWVGSKPTGAETTISSNPLSEIDSYLVFHGAVTYQFMKSIAAQISVNNILNTEYFHPGVRSANGGYYAAIMPQNERSIMLKVMFDF